MRTPFRRRPSRVAVAGLISLSLVVAACGGDDADVAETPAETEPEPDRNEVETVETDLPPETVAPIDTAGESGEGTEVESSQPAIEADDIGVEGEPEPVAGGTLRYGREAEVDGLNPTTSALSASGLTMAHAVFDTLTAWSVDDEPVPYLAESWETVGGDTSVWEFTLRAGIVFHDGTPLDADAVLLNFETQRSDPLVGIAVRPFVVCSPSRDEGCDSEVEPLEVIDDLTVRFNLSRPNAHFAAVLASQVGMVASPAWLAAALEDPTLNQKPVGTGEFVFESRAVDSVTRFVRNDEWWNGEVHLDAIEFVIDTDPDSMAQRLLSGELQAMATDNPATVGDLLDEPALQVVIDELSTEEFVMLNSEVAPFDDVRARRALALATPRGKYHLLIGLGIAAEADQRFHPDDKYHDPDVLQEGDDPAAAAELVADYCAERGSEENTVLGTPACTDGRINMEYQWSGPSVVGTRTAELMDEGWGDSFNVTFDEKPQDEQISEVAFGQYNTALWSQFGDVDPWIDNVWLICETVGGISLNWPRFCNPDRDALLFAAQASDDESERIALYQEQTAQMNEEYLYVFLRHNVNAIAFAPELRGQCGRTNPEGDLLRCAVSTISVHDATWLAR